MKKVLLCTALLFAALAYNKDASAQVRLGVNVNIGSQPDWGPVGYDHVDYYYMPDIQSYYYVPTRQFIYLSGGNWVFSSGLPPAYRGYNLYSGYKVVVNQPKAYLYYPTHRTQYAKYRGNRNQSVIINSRELKYKRNGHDNGNHYGNGNGNGNGKGKGKGNGRH
ncbi:MAG: hypothetical protein ABIT05_12500 [Chitinophagaceae bacterium]